ncbi:hypothetical protein ACHAXA_007081 [Cyclostephanos tholiformis]|uniref:F-box domain-containing protein n=1 Tax=Cyclostephanos tholiformis TaxID=382380 RepID=A0ABD3RZ62_9STRA
MGRPSRCTPSVVTPRMTINNTSCLSSCARHADEGIDANNEHAREDRAYDCSISSRGASSDCDLPDFIIPAVMEYLGVRSLLRFGATCKYHAGLLSREVERRRAYVADIEAEFARLTRDVESAGGEDDGDYFIDPPTRANITAAKALARRALRYIDDEVDFDGMFLKRHPPHFRTWEDYVAEIGELDYFFHERKKFLRLPDGGSLYMLPDAFYFPPRGEDDKSSPAQIIYHTTLASKSWVVIRGCDDNDNLYHRSIEGIANWLVEGRWSSKGAYRIAARKLVTSLPYSCAREQALGSKAISYFSSILHKADDMDAMDASLNDTSNYCG